MRLYYLDTSALLKRYKIEKGSENIDDLFQDLKRIRESIMHPIKKPKGWEGIGGLGIVPKRNFG